jgi:NADPH2:quinone reductase
VLGADTVIDDTEPDWLDPASQATGSTGPHIVFDRVGEVIAGAASGVTAEGGRFSAHGAPSGGFAAIDHEDAVRRGVTVHGIEQVQFAPGHTERLTARVFGEAAAGRLRPVIGQT